MRLSRAMTACILLAIQPSVSALLCQVGDAPVTGMETPATVHVPRPNPDANGLYHVGDGVTPPKIVSQVIAEYSDEARRAQLSGFVIVGLTIDEKGTPTNIHVMRSLANVVPDDEREAALSLDRKAVEAVQQYRFSPAMFNGKPVPVNIDVHISFCIARGGCRP